MQYKNIERLYYIVTLTKHGPTYSWECEPDKG